LAIYIRIIGLHNANLTAKFIGSWDASIEEAIDRYDAEFNFKPFGKELVELLFLASRKVWNRSKIVVF